jgi:colanic acid/amylovoran biosynthesis glycosyltransferase
MNIAIIIGTFPTLSETFISNQIIALLDKGHKVDVLAYSKGTTDVLHQNIVNYNLLNTVSYFNTTPVSRFKRIQFLFQWIFSNFFSINWRLLFKALNVFKYGNIALSLNLFCKSLWFLKTTTYDIVHVHFGHNAILIADLKEKGFLNNSKLIVSFHGYDLIPSNVAIYKEQYSKLFKWSHAITVNTLYTKDILKEVAPEINNVFVLPVGLDTTLFCKSKNTKIEVFTILYCGRLVPFKGATLTLSILNELINRGYRHLKLEIIGEGVLEDELKQNIKSLQLEDYVTLHGALDQVHVKTIMEDSNVFLLPGITEANTFRAENQGLVIQEAQAMELPVVVSDAGGMKFGLLPNKSGFVIKEKNIKGFADAIEQLIRNKALCQTMGRTGRDFVVKHYDNKVLVNKLLEIYLS